MADGEWSYTRRRIPITKGWGPCKRTHWVPVNEHYTERHGPRLRTFSRAVGIDPDAHLPTQLHDSVVYVLPDDDDRHRYVGFRERDFRPGDAAWRYHPTWEGQGRAQGRPPVLVPEGGYNGVWPWQPPIPWGALDPTIAADLQEVEALRAQRHRTRVDEIQAEIGEIGGRIHGHVDGYVQNLARNLMDGGDEQRGRLEQLRAEIAALDEEQARRRRAEEERMFLLDREWERERRRRGGRRPAVLL